MKRNIKKWIRRLINGIVLLFLIHFIWSGEYKILIQTCQSITKKEILLLVLIGGIFYFFQCFSQFLLISNLQVKSGFKKSFDITALGLIGHATTSSVGTIPLQSYYWSQCDIPYGKGLGISMMNMIFHKLAVCINAFVIICANFTWIQKSTHLKFIVFGWVVNFCIILCMLLLLLDHNILNLFVQKIKNESLACEVDNLFEFSKQSLKNKKRNRSVFLASWIKIIFLCTIPYLCLRMVGIQTITFLQAYTLSSIVVCMSGVLPSIAGMGPVEGTFLLYFLPFASKELVFLAMILYRVASYFCPLIIGFLDYIKIQKLYFVD